MRKLRVSLLLLLLTGLCLPQQVVNPNVRRVGERLACKCGSCNNTVGNCPMLQCHYSSPAREKIEAMLAENKSDDDIIASFVKESGLGALAAPPAEGFNLLGWVMPFVALALGLGIVYLWIKRMRRPATAGAPSAAISSKYQERIDREMADFE